jgi:uncharacterized protein (TIGR03067 family)
MNSSVIAIAVCLLLTLRVPSTREAEQSVEPLRGVWWLRSTADARRTDPGSMDCTMTIGGDGQVVLRLRELVTNQGTVRVRRAGAARHIDLKLGSGLVLGVYELNGDELTICCDEPGKARPDGLQPRGTQWVERWQLAKR